MFARAVRIQALAICGIFILLFSFQAASPCYGEEMLEISVEVSPNMVNLRSAGEPHMVRVWTDIKRREVNEGSVFFYINANPVDFWLDSDSNGYLLVRFYVSELKRLAGEGALEIEDYNAVSIEGYTKETVSPSSQPFLGQGAIYVIDKKGN
jgi:hypothetical protein